MILKFTLLLIYCFDSTTMLEVAIHKVRNAILDQF